MKRLFTSIILIVVFLLAANVQGQIPDKSFNENGEVYFTFHVTDHEMIPKISAMVTIDDVRGDEVWAYADRMQFSAFLKTGIPYQILTYPEVQDGDIRMLDKINMRGIAEWDFYPTYEAYLDMMGQFVADHPALCDTLSIGQSVEGRELMMLKISRNVGTREAEPQFLYTGTMHGDELVGYVLLLRLADYLLSNYGTDPEVTWMIDNIEIWINPLANPDGTYKGGNHTVLGSIRNNANGVNLNRNYPDPDDGPHPDGNDYQPETLAFMQLAEDYHFVMSANTHAGAEVINYPWDTWSHLTADDDWWVFVSREYADTVHQYAPSTYLDGFDNGITNGYAWYTISGGRQDYMNYFHHCREVTMELSNVKKLSASLLPAHWEYNYRSLLNYIKQCAYGVRGIVTDQDSGDPLHAKVYIEGHDMDNSFVYTDPLNGFYQRLLEAGTYDITYSAEGYYPVTIQNVNVARYQGVNLDVQLSAGELMADFEASATDIPAGTAINFTDLSFGNPVSWQWTFEGGTPSSSTEGDPSGIIYESPGIFDVTLTVKNGAGDTSSLTKSGYIIVSNEYLMTNGNFNVCDGLFYDTGGADQNYTNNEDLVMTFLPSENGSFLQVAFLQFELEYNSACDYDWLRIYDGASVGSSLMGEWCGTSGPGILTATNAEGALTFQFHSDYSVTKPGWKAAINCIKNQQLMLDQGWSGISLFLNPVNPGVEDIFDNVLDDLEIIIGRDGVFWPSHDINTINNWNTETGYVIKMNASAELSVSGTNPESGTVPLLSGWNYLPVVSSCPVSVQLLQSELGDQLVVIKDIAGVNTYWPGAGIYSLVVLESGKAYLIYLLADGEFTFPVCE